MNSLRVLFLINLLIGFVISSMLELFGWGDWFMGFLAGFVVIGLYNREYMQRMVRLVNFLLYLLWQIIVSNLNLAWTILQPAQRMNARLDPGIIGVPLKANTVLEITMLATVITLTPGTLSVDLGKNREGETVLYIHDLRVEDPEAFRASIQNGFERRILQITRGTA